METNLLDRMLSAYRSEQTPVTVTLQNKIRVSGRIRAFDSYVIVMEGQKIEILYRHAVSSLAPQVPDEQRRQPVQSRQPMPKPASRQHKSAAHKPRPSPHQTALSAAPADSGINTTMKDGLLKWMQEQKAAK